jgi:hypothetical protein
VGHRIEECLPFSGIFDLLQLLRQVEIIPADDAVLDEPLAGFLHLLVFFLCLQEFLRVAYRDSARKAVHVLKGYPSMPASDERFGSNELVKRLSESAERVLSGRIHQIRIQGDCPPRQAKG